jgi:hypothetical protein
LKNPPIVDLVDDVVDIELTTYNKIKWYVVKQIQRKRKINLDNVMIYTTKVEVLDAKKTKLG